MKYGWSPDECLEERDDLDNIKNEKSSGIDGGIAKIAENLMARGIQRNEIGVRLRRLRETLMSKLVSEDLAESRDDVSVTSECDSEGTARASNVRDVIQQTCHKRETQQIPSADSLAHSCRLENKEEEIRLLQCKLEQARKELKSKKEKEGQDRSDRITSAELKNQLESKMEFIDVLEVRLTAKDRRIKRLTEDLTEVKRRNVELEVKLEIHDLKFISYEKHKHALEKQVLRPISENNDGSFVQSSNQECKASPENHSMKLLSDLDAMEKLYTSAKQYCADKVAKLQKERDGYIMKIKSLEAAASLSNEVSSGKESEAPLPSFGERMNVIQTENAEYRRLVSSLKWQLESLMALLGRKEQKFQRECGILSRKNHCLESKIAALETELQAMSGMIDGTEKSRQYRMLESSLDDYISEISRLEERLHTKDRIISSLRTKAVEMRIASIEASEQPHQAVSDSELPATKLVNAAA